MPTQRFPFPWSVEDIGDAYVVTPGNRAAPDGGALHEPPAAMV
jgi:hypothetical protein